MSHDYGLKLCRHCVQARLLGRAWRWRAVQRLRDQGAAWHTYDERTGHHPQMRYQLTERELEQAIEAIAQQIEAIKRHETLVDRRLGSAKGECCARRLSR